MRIRNLITAAMALCMSAVAYSQSAIRVQAPNMVAADEQFNVSFIIEGEHSPSSFSWTEGPDFQLVWGPQKGSSSSISIVNGKRTSSRQVSYTYVLMPKSSGKFTLPAAQAVVKGNTIVSSPFQIEVVGGGGSVSHPRGEPGQVEDTDQQNAASDIFMKLTLSKTRVVVGEPLSATLKLYQRINIAGFENAKFPTFNGFWSEETEAPSNIEFHRENVGGNIYNAAVIRRWTLVPQQKGELDIEPAELVCLVNVRTHHSPSGSIFDSFFQDDYQTVRKRLVTPSVRVRVADLPGGAPSSFSGGVGKFNMRAVLSADSLRTHDAASLKVVVTGRGNVPLLEAPKLSFPPDFECYDVKTTDVSGGKQFEYPFIPRSHGEFVIGPVEYSYYDIAEGRYVTLKSSPMPLKVSKGTDEATAPVGGQTVAAPAGQKEVRNLGNDVRYIVSKAPHFSSGKSFFVGSSVFWCILAFIICAAFGVWFFVRRMLANRADVAFTKSKGATKVARKRLSSAGAYLGKDLYSAFYEELHKALLGYVSDKLTMDMADMSKENISARLSRAGVPGEVGDEFVHLLDACEFARYSPSGGHEEMSAHYESALNVITIMDDSLKSVRKVGSAVSAALSAMIFLALPSNASAAETSAMDSLWNVAVSAYEAENWQEAVSAWKAIDDAGFGSDVLYYNIGNACFKNSDISGAVVYYRRALKLNPSNEDARINLEFVNSRIQDKVDSVPEFFLSGWVRRLSYVMDSNYWAAAFLFFVLVLSAALLLFLLGRKSSVKKAGFYVAIASLLAGIVCISFSMSQKSAFESKDRAVVTSGVSSVKSSPGVASTDLFVIHEGLTVTVTERVGEWSNIEISDGREGWMLSKDLEII